MMITLHDNGTNLLNLKSFVSYNSQRSQHSVFEDEINLEVLKVLHTSSDGVMFHHFLVY